MEIEVKVLGESICRDCPTFNPTKQTAHDIEFIGGLPFDKQKQVWKCEHYSMCRDVMERIARVIHKDEEVNQDGADLQDL